MTLSDDVESISAVVSATRATIVLIEDEALFAKAVIRRLSKAGFNCVHAPFPDLTPKAVSPPNSSHEALSNTACALHGGCF